MKTLVIASQKGGVAKTTTATELAYAAKSAGLAVAVLDTDPQATSCFWAAARGQDDIAISPVFPALLPSRIKALESAGILPLLRTNSRSIGVWPASSSSAGGSALSSLVRKTFITSPLIFFKSARCSSGSIWATEVTT